MSLASPKIIPRVHLSPKVKQRILQSKPSPKRRVIRAKKSPFKKSPLRRSPLRRISPKKSVKRLQSPRRNKVFLSQRESFRSKPTVNPATNRTIKINGDTYKKLVQLYGQPY